MDKYEELKQIINNSQSIVVFTGAGISVPSGVPDFRSADGIYNQKTRIKARPEEIISHSFFISHLEEFYEFYKEKMVYPKATYNTAHKYFADLQNQGKRVIVVTQNIDGFHQEAGSKIVYELHGSIHRNFCTRCSRFFNLDYIMKQQGIPYCDKCGAIVKPDVVLYEEGLDEDTIQRALSAIMTSETMIILGTSLTVYPAASFVRYFKGRHLILINKESTNYDNMCDLCFNEDIISVINKIK